MPSRAPPCTTSSQCTEGLAAEAGLRIGEIRGLQWSDVKPDHIVVRRAIDQAGNVTAPKSNKSRKVPLSPALLTHLAKLPKRAGQPVGNTPSNATETDHPEKAKTPGAVEGFLS